MDVRTNGITKRGQDDHATNGPAPEQRDGQYHRRSPERRYQQLFATAHDGILLLDANTGRIIDANPFMTNLLGHSHDELLGKELWEVGLLRDGERSRATSEEFRQPGFVRHEDLFLQSPAFPDGIDVEVISNSYEEDDHRVIQCHIRDITARKYAARIASLRVDELVVADRRKDEFLAVLGHELRNVLAPVANALAILRHEHEAINPFPNRARTLIERQMGHLTKLVDDLLDVSRLEAEQLRHKPSRIDLRVAVQRSLEAVSAAHIDRIHHVIVALPEDPVWLDADLARIEQVVVNLMSNAVKYTDDGGRITVRVSVGPGRAELRIADNGIGIAPEELPQLFVPFARTERARERSASGLGLGLSIVQRIVDLHGGSVVAQSAGLGAGTEFTVFLPLANSRTPDDALESATRNPVARDGRDR